MSADTPSPNRPAEEIATARAAGDDPEGASAIDVSGDVSDRSGDVSRNASYKPSGNEGRARSGARSTRFDMRASDGRVAEMRTPGSGIAGSDTRERRRAAPRGLWPNSEMTAAVILASAAGIAFVSTWFLLSPAVESADRRILSALVIGNIAIAGGFAVFIGLRLWDVVSNRRHQLAGSRTHLQLVGAFAMVAVIPAIIAFLFAFTILRSSLNDVFGDRIENYVNTSLDFANTYFNDEASADYVNLRQIEVDLLQDQLLGLTPRDAPIAFRQRLRDQVFGRDLAALIILGPDREVIARAIMDPGGYALPARDVFDRIDAAAAAREPKPNWGDYGLNDAEAIDYFRGVLKSEVLEGGYIVIYRAVPAALGEKLLEVRAMRDDWRAAKTGRSRIERVFLLGYIILAVIILFGAVWAALQAATRIVQPIGRLVQMASRVSSGDLNARVDVYREDGELGALSRAMNHMTAQLETQRNDLIETNRQFDRRRRFTEAVLSGVSSGVMGLSAEGRLTITNRAGEDLLGVVPDDDIGRPVSEFAPEIASIFDAARRAGPGEVGGQVEIERGGRRKIVNVRIVCDDGEGGRSYVATFDDITELIGAQRAAAWGDVARRIAHEIKNPLTPIQLSAERLRRKYRSEISSAPEIFDKCTETIIRHVNDIGRMVDEFSSFARMPKPAIAEEDVRELLRSAVFTQRVAFPELIFDAVTPDEPTLVDCDGRLIVQALGNILKNASESIDARLVDLSEPPGQIRASLSLEGDVVTVTVMDNGVGLPKAERHRLTEPYMTTRAKGTGLGLAIVRKVIEDHAGHIDFDDCTELGPTGAMVTIRLPRAGTATMDATQERGGSRADGYQGGAYQGSGHQDAKAAHTPPDGPDDSITDDGPDDGITGASPIDDGAAGNSGETMGKVAQTAAE